MAASIALLAPSAAAQQSDEQPSNNGRAPATFAALPSINVREHGASLSISSAF